MLLHVVMIHGSGIIPLTLLANSSRLSSAIGKISTGGDVEAVDEDASEVFRRTRSRRGFGVDS